MIDVTALLENLLTVITDCRSHDGHGSVNGVLPETPRDEAAGSDAAHGTGN